MSTINKKPFIKKLLASMGENDLVTLSTLMDGEGDQAAIFRTLNIREFGNRSHITETDVGVHLCDLEIGTSLFRGYLIYNEPYCVLLQFTDFQRIQMFKIGDDKLSYDIVDEYLDINELRSELDDRAEIIMPEGNTKIVSILSVEDMQTKITYDNLIKPISEGKEVVIVADLGLASNPPSPNGMIGYFRSSFVNPQVVIFEQILSALDYPLDPTILNEISVLYDDVEETIINFQIISFNFLDQAQIANKMLAKEFVSGTSYYVGDVVAFNGKLYQCTADNSGTEIPSSGSSYWTETTIAESVLGLLNTGV